jgi:hypothetical protein
MEEEGVALREHRLAEGLFAEENEPLEYELWM